MGDFKEQFVAYGADYEGTMQRFMGNEAMYMKFLGMLFQDDNLQKLGDAICAGDLAGAFAAAHTLKGVVGNMGLTPLYQAVCAIVEPLRNGERREDYPALYEAVQQEFQRVGELRNNILGGEQV